MLYYTGHPLLDVGIAALTAYAEQDTPEQLRAAHLEDVAGLLAQLYTQPGLMRNFVRGAVFHNAGYTSSSDPFQQQAYIERVLYSWRSETFLADSCFFCGRPAVYRAARREVPLLNGMDTYNFSAAGQAGIAILSVG